MKKGLHFYAILSLLLVFTSCETLKDLGEQQLDKHLTCVPATGTTYNSSYQIISKKKFEDDRLQSANRETTRLKCMTTNQIKKVTELLKFEDSRLEYAKFAYAYCSNPEQYYTNMETLLKFQSSKNELEALTR